ncbi:MAG: hypothetical protein ACLP01_31455 [Solirubrobacteraceae bacterium]
MPSAELQGEVAEPVASPARPRVREQLMAAVLREREREVQDPELSARAAIGLVAAAR